MSYVMVQRSGPVLIVGGGPAGMAAALELRQWGVDVTIIDALERPRTTSRAGGVQPRTYELLDRYGMSEVLIAGRNGVNGMTLFQNGKQVAKIETHLARSRYAQPPGVPQAQLEEVFRTFLAKEDVQVLWSHELISLTEDESGMLAKIRTPDRIISFKADWVLGCDGARSTVRKLAGLNFVGISYPEAWGLMDARLDWELDESALRVFKDDGAQQIVIVPFGGTHYRLQIDHRDTALQDQPPTIEEIQTAFDRLTGVIGKISNPTWASDFRLHRRQVEHYRAGRIFLAGDAAHIHAPAGAQGLNTGVQDAINLGWKLALVVRGEANAALLDTYERERWPIAQGVLKLAETLAQNPELLLKSAELPRQVLADTHAQLLVNYREGPLGAPQGASGIPVAGDRLPDVLVGGQRVYLKLRHAKVVVSLFGDEDAFSSAARQFACFGDAITIWKHNAGDELAEALGMMTGAAVIRPDAFLGVIVKGELPQATVKIAEWLRGTLGLGCRGTTEQGVVRL